MSDETIVGQNSETATVLRVLSASAQRAALLACAEVFCARQDDRIHFFWATSGAVLQKVRSGESFDLIAASRNALGELARDGLVPDAIHDVGASRIALGMRKGESPPDISTVENFRKALIDAKHFSRGDPAGGGTAGNFLADMLKSIGLLEETSEKSILRVGGFNVMKEVAEGRADFGLTQSTEIVAVKGVEISAWLPDDLQMETAYAIGQANQSDAHNMPEVAAFLSFVTGSEGRKIYKDAGFF